MLVSPPVTVIKHPNKSRVGEKEFILTPSVRIQLVHDGGEATGVGSSWHVVSAVRKQREVNARAQLTFSFHAVQDGAQGMVLPTVGGYSYVS